jgi:hypothetical protein
MSEYPKWRYHAAEKAVIVRDPEHEDAEAHSDAGWVNHPSQFPEPEPEPEPEAAADESAEPEAKKKTRKR